MELPSEAMQDPKDLTNIQPQKNPPMATANKNQIQNAERVSHAPSISENIRQIMQNEMGQGLPREAGRGQVQYMFYKGWMCGGSTVIQFSILNGLIIIQYISSAIATLPFLAVLLISLLLHPSLVLLIYQMQTALRQSLPRSGVEPAEERIIQGGQIRTLPKINQQANKRGNAKTKKLKYAKKEISAFDNTQLTIKKEAASLQSAGHQEVLEQVCCSKHNVLLILKVVQVVVEVAVPSFCIYSSDDIGNVRKIVMTLSILAYLMALISSVAFSMFFKEINRARQVLSSFVQQTEMDCLEHPQPNTKISIEQLIQSRPQLFQQQKSLQSRKSFSIDQKCSNVPKVISHEVEIKPKQELKLQVEGTVTKLEIKRSVLKPSKIHETKVMKNSQDIAAETQMERRKVEINSKKIQYFQYCVSPSKQSNEDKEARQKSSKLTSQRMKIIKQRMEAEAKLLAEKILTRKNKAKSQTHFSTHMDHNNQHQEPKLDDFF